MAPEHGIAREKGNGLDLGLGNQPAIEGIAVRAGQRLSPEPDISPWELPKFPRDVPPPGRAAGTARIHGRRQGQT
jgi:hypothetical protein